MKDIKTIMIGFLLASCMFLMMGQGLGITPIVNLNDSQIGRYQGFADEQENWMIDQSKDL